MTRLLELDALALDSGPQGLAVRGEVDFDVASALAAAGCEWLSTLASGTCVDFDLTEVAGVSSAALSVLLEWTRRAHDVGLDVKSVRLSASLVRLTRLAGIDRLLPLSDAA
jgi:phospholipid transport system transporter-binding protein